MFLRRKEDSAKRKAGAAGPFWRISPGPGDPSALHRIGIQNVVAGDGRGMIATGWAIWDVAGLNQFQAVDFSRDGYQKWVEAGAPVNERFLYLWDVLGRLQTIQPEIGPEVDVYALPPHIAQPASTYYGMRSWTVSEILIVADRVENAPIDLNDTLFGLLQATNPAFMAPRTLSQYRYMCEDRGIRNSTSAD